MKSTLRGMLSLVAVFTGGSAMVQAFSVGVNLQQNLPIKRGSSVSNGRIRSQHTRVSMADSPTRAMSNEAKLMGEKARTEEPMDYISQEGTFKLGATAVFGTGIVTVLSLAVVYQMMGTDLGTINNLQEAAMKVPKEMWASYSEVLAEAPIQTKAVTSATVYTIGDVISQRTEGVALDEVDKPRVIRSLLAGLIGHGPLSHCWYEFSENLFQNVLHLPNDIFGTAAKVAIDQTTWGPFWNNTYILLLGLMKYDSFEMIFSEMKRTTIPLIVSGLKLWPLAHCVTYGLVPVENRLLWVDVVEIVWVTILATAAAGKTPDQDEKQANPQ